MAAWVKFNSLTENIAEGVHNLGSDTINAVLTNTAPTAANTVIGDISQISTAGGYAPATVTITGSAQSGGTYALTHSAIAWTASGAAFDPFRWIVLFNDTAASDELIAFIDYGAPYTLADGQPFTIAAGTILTLA